MSLNPKFSNVCVNAEADALAALLNTGYLRRLLPEATCTDGRDRRTTDAEHLSDRTVGVRASCQQIPNSNDLRFRQFRHRMLCSAQTGNPVPSLVGHVSHVVAMGAKKQMRHLDAGRIVAGVAHLSLWRNLAVLQRPGVPMGVDTATVSPADLPIAGRCAEASPDQAIALRFNSRPEGFRRNRPLQRFLKAGLRAELLGIRGFRDSKDRIATDAQTGVCQHSGYLNTWR